MADNHAGDFAVGLLEDLDREATFLAEAQVHALEHGGPVLRLGAARAGLDVDEAVGRVHRVVEHALEFEPRDLLLDRLDVGFDAHQRFVVVLLARHAEEFA